MVGELPDPSRVPGMAPRDGDELLLVGPFAPSLAGSELAKLRGDLGPGLPALEISEVAAAIAFVRELARSGAASAIHDVSDGGLACALAEMAIAGGVGLGIELDPLVELRGASGETCLFGEGPGGFLVALPEASALKLVEEAAEGGVGALRIGSCDGERIVISAAEAEASVALEDAERAWRSLPSRVDPGR